MHSFAFQSEMDGCTVVVVSILLEIAESWCTHLHFGMKRMGVRVLCLLWWAHSFAFHWNLYLGVPVLLLDVMFWILERDGWVHDSCVLFDECIDLHRKVKCICVDWSRIRLNFRVKRMGARFYIAPDCIVK